MPRVAGGPASNCSRWHHRLQSELEAAGLHSHAPAQHAQHSMPNLHKPQWLACSSTSMPCSCSCATIWRNSAAAARLLLRSPPAASCGSAAMWCTAARDSKPMPAWQGGRWRIACWARAPQPHGCTSAHFPNPHVACRTAEQLICSCKQVHVLAASLTLGCGIAGGQDDRVGAHGTDVRRPLRHPQVAAGVLHALACRGRAEWAPSALGTRRPSTGHPKQGPSGMAVAPPRVTAPASMLPYRPPQLPDAHPAQRCARPAPAAAAPPEPAQGAGRTPLQPPRLHGRAREVVEERSSVPRPASCANAAGTGPIPIAAAHACPPRSGASPSPRSPHLPPPPRWPPAVPAAPALAPSPPSCWPPRRCCRLAA